MLTKTSFNAAMLAKIDVAMRDAVAFSGRLTQANQRHTAASAYVTNRRHTGVLRVSYYRGCADAFQFYDNRSRNITAMVLQVLRKGGAR